MEMNIFIAIFFLIIFYLALGLGLYLYTYDQTTEVKGFRKDLKKAIIAGIITYSDILEIADRWKQSRGSVRYNLQDLLSKATKDEDKLKDSIGLIRSLLIELKEDDPFSQLPANISLELEGIKQSLDISDQKKVNHLANSLSPLYLSSQEDVTKQKKRELRNSFLTALGTLLTVYVFLERFFI